MNQHFDRENAIRTDRIAHYEEIMDRIIRVVKLDGITPGVYESVLPGLKELEDYYTSPEWQEDYAADEAGLLPEGLKRGVLSQDGISDLLDRFRDLKTHHTFRAADPAVFRPETDAGPVPGTRSNLTGTI